LAEFGTPTVVARVEGRVVALPLDDLLTAPFARASGAAQIKATALALKMGKGPYWWPNTYGPAFSGT
jgi:hypothetical protein